MEHWFDALSRPHSRRAALKTALAVGVGLGLPALRPPAARATPKDPCWKPCIDAAGAQWNAAFAGCRRLGNLGGVNLVSTAWLGLSPNTLLGALEVARWLSCDSSAELAWYQATTACKGEECGNPDKYPGGAEAPPPKKPTKVCNSPDRPIVCGDDCCASFNKCCPNPQDPSGYSCYGANATAC